MERLDRVAKRVDANAEFGFGDETFAGRGRNKRVRGQRQRREVDKALG